MLQNKIIVLTGSTGGIGSEIAKMLYAEGAQLILVGLDQDSLIKQNQQLGSYHKTIEADISTSTGRATILQQCQEGNQGIDILINNAGIGQFSLFETMTEDQINMIINVNLNSTILLTQTLLPLLQAKEAGQIINIGSILGSIGFPGSTIYCASKFGIRGFTEALRREYLDSNLTVRYFAPRATKTAINNADVEAMNVELGTDMDSAESVAQQLNVFLKNRKASYYLGWPEKFFVRINSVLPSIVESSITKQLATIKRYLK